MKKIKLKDFTKLNKGDMLYLVNKKVKRHKWIVEFLKFKENKKDWALSKLKARATPLFNGGYAWERFKIGESFVRNDTLYSMRFKDFKICLVETEEEKEKMNKELIVAKLNYDEVKN